MPGYVELHTHSSHSFLDGASDVAELVEAAVERGMDALALTDTNGLYGAVRSAHFGAPRARTGGVHAAPRAGRQVTPAGARGRAA